MIKSQKNDAIVQVKENNKTLFSEIRNLTTTVLEPISTYTQTEKKKHNRIEQRETSVFELSMLHGAREWRGVFSSVARVRRYTDLFDTKLKKWNLRMEVSYYASTCTLDAEAMAICIRNHWHIENKNHYVRDVSLGEDASRIRKNPGIFARLRSMALNLFRKNGVSNVKAALFENALYLDNVLKYEGVF